jgi:hypothetical protein
LVSVLFSFFGAYLWYYEFWTGSIILMLAGLRKYIYFCILFWSIIASNSYFNACMYSVRLKKNY